MVGTRHARAPRPAPNGGSSPQPRQAPAHLLFNVLARYPTAAAGRVEFLQDTGPLWPESLLQLAPDTPRQRGRRAAGRDGDLEITPPQRRWHGEIPLRRTVGDVYGDPSFLRLPCDRRVDLPRARGRKRQVRALEVAALVGAALDLDVDFRKLRTDLRGDYDNPGPR